MGWWSKTWKKVKNVFKKVTKVVKKIVKSVGKTAKKVWGKVKGVAKKFSKGISKLGPFANIAMNFIPGFGQLWSAYGIWGQLAKGAITGFALTGSAQGALLGAASMGAADIFKNMPGTGIAEKVGNWFEGWTDSTKIGKAFGDSISKFKDAFKPAQKPWEINQTAMELEAYGGPRPKDWSFPQSPSPLDKHIASEYATKGSGNQVTAESLQPSLLDKFKDNLPQWSTPKLNPMDSAQAAQLAWSGDVSPLQSVAANAIGAGDVNKQFGYGKDVDEDLIRRIGLVPLLQQYQANIA